MRERCCAPEQDASIGAAERSWARDFLDALHPHSAGVYVNFLDADDGRLRVPDAYGGETLRRLAEVKARYDPDNVFHRNRNVLPAAEGPRQRSSVS